MVVPQPRRRRRAYLVLMGTCLALFVLAWGVVRFVSTPAAVAMSVVAALIPPVAAVVANAGTLRSLREPTQWAPTSDEDAWERQHRHHDH